MKLIPEIRRALSIAAIYVALAALWIVFSDQAVDALFADSQARSGAQTRKGLLFVLITALVLFFLVHDALRRHARALRRNLETAQRLLSAASMVPVGIFSADDPGKATFANEAAVKILGLRADEHDGVGWLKALHEDDRERLTRAWQTALQQGANLNEEFRLARPDGTIVWVQGSAAPQFDDDGKLMHYVGTLVDITDRKLAELAARETMRLYRGLAELSPAGIYHADGSGSLSYINPQLGRIAGVPPEALLGDGWIAYVHADDRDRVVANWQAAVEGRTRFHEEYRFQSRDGTVRWVVEDAMPQIDEAGRFAGFIGTLMDVTQLKRTVAELERTETSRRLIFELEPECVKVLAPDGALVEMNPAGLRMIDADSLEQVKGKVMADLVVPEHRAAFVALHKRVIAGSDGTLEFDVVSLKGVRRHFETHAVPMQDSGKVVGVLGVTRDVTERRKAEEFLKQSESRYRELFESNPMPMCVWDPETFRFLAVNEAMVRHYGYSREELLSMSVTDIKPPEDIAPLKDTLTESGKGLYAAGIWRHIKKGGQVIEVDIRSHPVTWAGRTARLAQMIDVTSQRRAELALQQERESLQKTTGRLNYILTTSPTLLYSVRLKDGAFTPLWISENVERIFGYPLKEAMEPEWWLKHMHPDDRESSIRRTGDFETMGTLIDEFRFFRKNGQLMWLRAEARVVSRDPETGMDIVGTWSDITQDRKREERLRLDAAAIGSTRDGVMITDLNGIILSVNRAFVETSGFSEAELLGRSPRMFLSGRHGEDFFQSMWSTLVRTGQWQGEIWNRDRLGRVFPEWLTISTVYNDRKEPTHYVAIYTDISKLKQSEEEMHRLAHFDPLTALPNRLLLESRLQHAVDQAQRRGSRLAVVFLDLDDFKKVNDSLGHVVGDELLTEIAARLRVRVRDEDTLARLGGDEFIVLLESLKQPEDAAAVARDLLASIGAPIHLPSNHELHVHGSIGIAVYPEDGDSPAELLRAADTAMYRAKDEGGDRFLYFTSEMSNEVLANVKLENSLRQALARNEFMLHFQPTRQFSSGDIRGAEALLRWHSPGSGNVPPGVFIPVAERTGLIVPIGKWVLDAACAQYAVWSELGLPALRIKVNVSARQFRSADLEEAIAGALTRHGVPPDRLTLELTESMLMDKPAESAAILERLKEIGVGLSLDDFGTGFSSLAYLTRFPVDTLKIDGSFVRSIEKDESARKIIKSIVELAQGLGMETVAEGVETEEQERFLKDLGCDAMQGFLFSKPISPADFVTLFRSHAGRKPADGRGRKKRAGSRAR